MRDFISKVTKVAENITLVLGVVSALGAALQLFTDKLSTIGNKENETEK